MIVIVYPQFYGVGGIGRYLESFLSNLPPGSPEILLITGEPPEASGGCTKVETIHVPVASNRWGLILWSWKVRRLLVSMNRSRPISAVNLHMPPLIPGLFLLGSFPLVLTAHTTYVGMSGRFDDNRHFSSPWNAVSLWLKTHMERLIFSRADTVITLTEQGRQELVRYRRRDRVAIVPNGVDLAEFVPTPEASPDFDVIFSGRIERRKGSRPMVEVCRRLVAAHPRIRIAIVGYGDDDDFVRTGLAELKDNVVLYGKAPFSEMVGHYRRSKVYVSTSYYEGLPGTCLEAMAMGLPVVVWDLLFYRDLVVSGMTGLTAPVNDTGALVDSVGRLLADPDRAAAMGRNAREAVRDRYDWRRLSGRLLSVYSQVRGQRPPVAVTP